MGQISLISARGTKIFTILLCAYWTLHFVQTLEFQNKIMIWFLVSLIRYQVYPRRGNMLNMTAFTKLGGNAHSHHVTYCRTEGERDVGERRGLLDEPLNPPLADSQSPFMYRIKTLEFLEEK